MAFVDSENLKSLIHKNHYILTGSHNTRDYGMFTGGIEQAIEMTTVADVEKVVRCKDCRSYNKRYGECTRYGAHLGENGFCSRGIRKEGADNG